jgi:hypothetical protein
MKAASRPKDEPDVVATRSQVKDTSLVRARILGLISNLVEPGILGIDAREIPESPGARPDSLLFLFLSPIPVGMQWESDPIGYDATSSWSIPPPPADA